MLHLSVHLPRVFPPPRSFGMLILGLINCVLGGSRNSRSCGWGLNLGFQVNLKAKRYENMLQNPWPKGVPEIFGDIWTPKCLKSVEFWSRELLNGGKVLSNFHTDLKLETCFFFSAIFFCGLSQLNHNYDSASWQLSGSGPVRVWQSLWA